MSVGGVLMYVEVRGQLSEYVVSFNFYVGFRDDHMLTGSDVLSSVFLRVEYM